MIDQQPYALTLHNNGAGLHYELSNNDGYTIASADPDCIVSALMDAFPMTEEEAAVVITNAITKGETYTIHKGMDSALPAMVLLHAWGIAPMRVAVYHRGRCRRRDGRPIMVRRLDQGYPDAPLVCPNCGKTIARQRALAFSFILEA